MPSWTHLFSETLCVTCRGSHMRQKVTRSLSTLSFIAPEFRRHFSFSFTNDYFSSLNYNNNKSNNHLLTSVDGCERTRHTNVLRSSFTVMMCCLWRVETNGHWTCRRGKRSRKKPQQHFVEWMWSMLDREWPEKRIRLSTVTHFFLTYAFIQRFRCFHGRMKFKITCTFTEDGTESLIV